MRKSLMFLVIAVFGSDASAQAPRNDLRPNPVPYAVHEPRAAAFSLEKGSQYLDVVARFWMKDSCGSCHANYTYLMARPLLPGTPDSAVLETRRFLENRLDIFNKAKKDPRASLIHFPSEAVSIAVALAFHDSQTAGKLQPTTRQALRQMWELQGKAGRNDGTWSCGCGEFPPAELDRYYAATLAALASGVAPEGYAQSPEAQDGLTRLRRYFVRNPAPHLHHQAMLLWASFYVDGLMTSAERRETVQALLAKQRSDGGWSLESLRTKTSSNDEPSDGYGTGFVVFVLRQAGVPANRPEMEQLARGVHWLRSEQRASGGWFTPSPHAGHRPEAGHGTRELSMLNAAASFAVMALHACEETEATPSPWLRHAFQRLPGLAFQSRLE